MLQFFKFVGPYIPLRVLLFVLPYVLLCVRKTAWIFFVSPEKGGRRHQGASPFYINIIYIYIYVYTLYVYICIYIITRLASLLKLGGTSPLGREDLSSKLTAVTLDLNVPSSQVPAPVFLADCTQ